MQGALLFCFAGTKPAKFKDTTWMLARVQQHYAELETSTMLFFSCCLGSALALLWAARQVHIDWWWLSFRMAKARTCKNITWVLLCWRARCFGLYIFHESQHVSAGMPSIEESVPYWRHAYMLSAPAIRTAVDVIALLGHKFTLIFHFQFSSISLLIACWDIRHALTFEHVRSRAMKACETIFPTS